MTLTLKNRVFLILALPVTLLGLGSSIVTIHYWSHYNYFSDQISSMELIQAASLVAHETRFYYTNNLCDFRNG